jgi:phage FluMu protein gp41
MATTTKLTRDTAQDMACDALFHAELAMGGIEANIGKYDVKHLNRRDLRRLMALVAMLESAKKLADQLGSDLTA